MKKIILFACILIAISSNAQSKDEQIIRKMLADQISFWNKGDIPFLYAFFRKVNQPTFFLNS